MEVFKKSGEEILEPMFFFLGSLFLFALRRLSVKKKEWTETKNVKGLQVLMIIELDCFAKARNDVVNVDVPPVKSEICPFLPLSLQS